MNRDLEQLGQGAKKELVDLMEEIRDQLLLSKADTEWMTFDAFPDDDVIEFDYYRGVPIAMKRRTLLEKLAELEVIELKPFEEMPREAGKLPDFRFKIKVNGNVFSPLFQKLGSKLLEGHVVEGNKSLYLHLDKDGNFWLDSNEALRYSLGANSDRLKILTYLVDNEGYQSPDLISEYLGGKDKKNIRSEIGKIRGNIEKYLKIAGDDLIQSKPDSGYRINPSFKIIRT